MLTSKDFSTALYALSKAKGYAATVVLTLGLTLGTLIAMFNLNYQILAAPLPYPDDEQLVVGSASWLAKDGSVLFQRVLPNSTFPVYQQLSDKVSDHALYGYSFTDLTLRDLANSPVIQVAYATSGFMRMYQMPMLHGRAFSQEEDTGSHQPVAVLSEQIWRSHYNADPALVGRSVRIGERDYKVIGIASSRFSEPRLISTARHTDVWLPWDFNPVVPRDRSSVSGWQFYLAKLKSPDLRQAFAQELTALTNDRYQEAALPGQAGRSLVFNAEPLRQILHGDSGSRTLWMLAGSMLLLLIAATNIMNLLFSRAARQQRAMSIQVALGAQRRHILGTILAELSWLMLGALLLAFAVAEAAYALLRQYAADSLPGIATLGLDWPVLLFAILSCLLLGLIFGQLINTQINYRAIQKNLQSSGKGSGVQISRRTRQWLICAQVTLAAMLLVCCLQVLLQALTQLHQDVGFASRDRYQITIDDATPAPAAGLPGDQRLALLRQRNMELSQVRDILLQHPAVEAAAVTNYPPVSFDGLFGVLNAVADPAESTQSLISRYTSTDQYYLPLFAIPLLQGRNFTAQEVSTQALVIIINQTFAEKLRPDGQVLGLRLHNQTGSQSYEVIGVSANHQLPDAWSAIEPNRSYMPRSVTGTASLALQLKPGMSIDKTAINQAMAQVSPQFKAAALHSMADNIDRVLLRNYLAAAVTTALVVLSFVLAAIGIYGVLSYSVQLRRFELGVRMAIGARPGTILRQLLGENLKPVLAGLVLAAALLVALWLGLQHTTFMVELSAGGFALPLVLIILLTTLTSLLSVWGIIRKPAIYALQGQ
ncbi:ABC transporter permease [Rheinheimera soli]|uniref:Permease n=1 Tax=Rheinheimera soli TaxID=443616 RepID=A0ABU1W364_9GAMM|nr:ABC transporter permease [Rheinheimera soli]MDR7122419.1 putative permease [Rheinheimera soli]